jgi:hypothetical protein
MTSIKYKYLFLAGLIVDDELKFNSYKLLLNLHVNTTSEVDQHIAFERMNFVIQHIFENGVFVDERDLASLSRLNAAGIRVITINEPGPIDQMVQITIVSKLNAITEGTLTIFESAFSSYCGGHIDYMYYVCDKVDEEPELISADPNKWWNDSYPRFTQKPEPSEICDINDTVTWADLDLQWEEDYDADNDMEIVFTSEPKKTSNIVNMVMTADDN